MSLSAGQKFGNYEILKPIGRGGMGEVYLAVDRRLKRQVAIKILSSALIENPDQLQRFRQEALFAAVLNHPNICTIYETGEVNGTTFIAMEHVEGDTLRHYLASHKISIAEILDYAIQIADALKEAHHKNVIHRDIKTSNIILTPRKTIKILDFGLAKQIPQMHAEDFSEASTDFSSGPNVSLRGTTPYMSPEGILGKKVDQRSDLFSFGVVLFELLTRQLPFRGSSNIEVIDAILHNDPLTGTQYQSDVPEPVVRVLRKMLEKDPEMRYQSAHEVWIDLKKIREEITRADSIPPTHIQVPKKPSFFKWIIPVVLVAILASLSTFYYLNKNKPKPGTTIQNVEQLKTIAVLPFDYSGDAEHKYFGTLVTDALIAGMESEPGVSVAPYITVLSVDKNEPVQEIAKKLGVRWIVRGTVSSKNTNVVIEPEVISSDGKKLWNQRIMGNIEGIVSTLNTTKNALISELKVSGIPKGKELAQLRTPITEAYEYYLQAGAYREEWDKQENLDKAIALYKKAIQADPDFAAAYAGFTVTLLKQYENTRDPSLLAQASLEARKAISREPNLPECQLANGLVLLKTGNSVEAKVAFSRSLDLAPGNDAACIFIAKTYETLGRNVEAKQMYERAIALRPAYWSNHFMLGRFLYLVVGDFNSARTHLLQAATLYPDGAAPLVVLGLVDLARGDLENAESFFQKVLDRHSDDYAQNGIGLVYYYRGKYDLALRNWQALLERSPNEPSYRANVADALRAKGAQEEASKQYVEAIEGFRRILALNPEDDQTRAGMAMALSAIGKCSEANSEIQSINADQSDSPELAAYAAVVASRCGDKNRAIQIVLKTIASKNVVDIRFHPDLQTVRQTPEVQTALKPWVKK